jgi:hypothetical protein
MSQAVSHRLLTADARVRTRVNQRVIFGGQNNTVANFFPSFSVSPVSIIPPWLSMLICHLGDEQ